LAFLRMAMSIATRIIVNEALLTRFGKLKGRPKPRTLVSHPR
jgi:hypothetical protein